MQLFLSSLCRLIQEPQPSFIFNGIIIYGVERCWHTHCSSAADLALDTLAAAKSFGVEQMVLLTQ
nr:hypothetical protein [Tanacetum cinerariifolium]